MGMCRWCNGTGVQYVERGSSLCYDCPDCNGIGFIPECEVCGEEYYGDYCEECYCECAECGEISLRYDKLNNLCEDCARDAEIVSENTENSRNVSVPAQK